MPDLRPVVADTQILEVLSPYFSSVTDLTALEGGLVARTLAFQNGEEQYVVRFTDDNMLHANLPKEGYVAQKLITTEIPIAPILHVGRLGTRHFAISRRMPGRRLETFTPSEVKSLMPQIIGMLDTIHKVEVNDTQGYGVFDDHGTAFSSSFPLSLSKIASEEEENKQGYYGKWHHMFDDTFLERDLFQDIYQHMQRLFRSIPNERWLIHGGYSLRNILAQDGKITAVLDWLGAAYGDFVYDIAGLDFWYPWLNVSTSFQQYYQEHQIALPAYEERILCYQCYTALVGLLFYAKGGNKDSYQWLRQAILSKLP
jgi:hygromycin-B 4-O-kinase